MNSVLVCPLTTEALDALTTFLGISATTRNFDKENEVQSVSTNYGADDVSSGDHESRQIAAMANPSTRTESALQTMMDRENRGGSSYIHGMADLPIEATNGSSGRTSQIFSILSACEGELLRAENRETVFKASTEGSTAPVQSVSDDSSIPKSRLPSLTEPLLPHTITEHFHDAMHEALMNVMAERDEAHAQLIATNVLHVHELEQERKKNYRLERKLEAAEARMRAMPTMPPLLMNLNLAMDDKLKREADEKARSLQTYEIQAKQDSDAELLTLCQQLAGEISAKTAATLEIIRLKESRDVERKNEEAEKQALKAELKRLKEMLAAKSEQS